MVPAGPFSLSLLSPCHFGYRDFDHAAILHPFPGDICCIWPKATVEGIQGDLSLIHLIKHPCFAIADDTITIDMAGISTWMLPYRSSLPSNHKADFRIRLKVIKLFPLKATVKPDFPISIVVIERNNIRLPFQRQPQMADLLFSQ